jgi:acyl carrier protein
MTITDIEDRVRQYVLATFLTETAPDDFRNTDDLFQLLDSLQVLRLVLQLEALFGTRVEDHELSAENLGSVRRVAAFVARKLHRLPDEGVRA